MEAAVAPTFCMGVGGVVNKACRERSFRIGGSLPAYLMYFIRCAGIYRKNGRRFAGWIFLITLYRLLGDF